MTQTAEPGALAVSATLTPAGGMRAFPRYPAYRESGVPWLGAIPAHWQVKRLKQTIEACQNGIWGDEPQSDDTDIGCVRVADFDRVRNRVTDAPLTVRSVPYDQRNGRMLTRGDLLLEKSGGGELQPVGTVVMYDRDEQAVCSNFIARMPVVRGYNPAFLCYVHATLYTAKVNVRSIKQNTGIQNLDSDAYLSERTAFPPLAEQRAIAAFLDRETARIDALVAAKRRLIELLREKRAALISRAVTRGLDASVPLRESGVPWLGAIPAHWQIVPLKYVSVVQTGITLGKDYRGRNVVTRPYLRVANVQDGYLDLSDIAPIDVPVEEVARYELRPGDVLMTEGGDPDKLGRGYVWHGQIEGCLHQNHIFAVRPNTRRLDPRFLASLLSSYYGKTYFATTGKQTTNLATTNSTTLGNFAALLPPVMEQQEILRYLDTETAKLDALAGRIEEQIARLREYRTALIAAAVTGAIDVRGQAVGDGTDGERETAG